MSSDNLQDPANPPVRKAGRPPGSKTKRDVPPVKYKPNFKGKVDARKRAIKELKEKVREQTLREVRQAQEAEEKARRAAEIARQKEEEAARLKAKAGLADESVRPSAPQPEASPATSVTQESEPASVSASEPQAQSGPISDPAHQPDPTPQGQAKPATPAKNPHTLRNALLNSRD